MSRTRIMVVTFAVMLSLFLAAVELTVVGTAMPTIISQLGGLTAYSWVFSVYALTSTTMTPIYGKLSDQFGRKSIYIFGMLLFLVGSALSGLAQSMPQLIVFRAIQGLGAGALLPLAFTVVGDIFTVEQRTRTVGLFNSVWGVASIVGPLLGGFLVDRASWRWVFYVNIPFGLLATAMLYLALREPPRPKRKVTIDYLGAGLFIVGITALLVAVLQGGREWAWLSAPSVGLFATFGVTFGLFLGVERRAAEPIIALDLFKDPMYRVAFSHAFLTGLALFGSTSFIPLFVQAVLGTSATAAGATLTPQILGWVTTSTLGTPLVLRIGYRRVVVSGMVMMMMGAILLAMQGPGSSQLILAVTQFLLGGGMGLSITTLLIAVQNRVTRDRMGAVTSGRMFAMQIGGAIGVSIMGAVMSARLVSGLAGLPIGAEVSPEVILDPLAVEQLGPATLAELRGALANAIQPIFLLTLVGTVAAFVVTLFTPRGTVRELSGKMGTQPAGGGGE